MNINRLFVPITLIFLLHGFFPETSPAKPQGMQQGNIRMYLYQSGTGTETGGTNMIYASLGDTITVDVFLRNGPQEKVTGLDIYFTVDNKYFSPVKQGQNKNLSMRPFRIGEYMTYAQNPEPFDPVGNYTHGDSLTANDNGIPGWQLDYVLVSPPDIGKGRPYSNLRYGVACTFQLVANAPGDSIPILLDDDHYTGRFARYSVIGANENYSFRSFQTCYITVTGMEINPPLPDVMIASGTSISTLDLDEHVGVSSIPDSMLTWSASGNKSIGVNIDPVTHVVTFTAPAGFRGFEDIVFTVSNGKGITASDTLRVTVDSPPQLLLEAIPDTLTIHEDRRESVLYLPEIVHDADDPYSSLKWFFRPLGGRLTTSVASDSLFLKGIFNFSGSEQLRISVYDAYGVGDSLSVPVIVLPVNDPPTLQNLPDISITRNGSHILDFGQYASDVDGDPLTLDWSPATHLQIVKRGMQVTFSGVSGFLGSETVRFTVTDPGGLSATDSLIVTLTPAKEPPVWAKIGKVGFPQNRADSSLVIWNHVSDPDDPPSLLTFVFSNLDNVDSVYVNPNTGRVTFYDLDDAPGWDRVTVTAYDPDGNQATTQFPVFIGPADGTPIVAGIPDTTIVAGAQAQWIDLDDYYYDVDNVDGQMQWTWGRQASADSSVTVTINPVTHLVYLRGIDPELFGMNRLFFTVTDPGGKFADDICIVTAVAINRPVLDLPAKVGFVTGGSAELDLDDYVQDAVYPRPELNWTWSGNLNSSVTPGTPDGFRTRPVTFSGAAGWSGWERVAFGVRNPLGGTAQDTVLVFSAPADGTPVAGGLDVVYLRAGTGVYRNLDSYCFDADTPDHLLTWSVSGGDSVTAGIDPISRTVYISAPSESWEGQNTLTFTVTDPEKRTATMQTTVIVTGAVIRNAFLVDIFRNPMQEDYMDIFVRSTIELSSTPELAVKATGDSTAVELGVITAGYYHGRYLLPLSLSLGEKGTGEIRVGGRAKDGKEVTAASGFAYGRIDKVGGKLAIGEFALSIPGGALEKPALVTVIPGAGDAAVAKAAWGEVHLTNRWYAIGPSTLRPSVPMRVAFMLDGDSRGAGVYRLTEGGPQYVGGVHDEETVWAEVTSGGTYALGYDRQSPVIRVERNDDEMLDISVIDEGSGFDPDSIRLMCGGIAVPFRLDDSGSTVLADMNTPGIQPGSVLEISAADRSGNTAAIRVTLDETFFPVALRMEQNVPNPFNPSTAIRFSLSRESSVRAEIFDMVGRRIATLADGRFAAGTHALHWDARDAAGRGVSSGAYFCRIIAGDRSETRKMLYLR